MVVRTLPLVIAAATASFTIAASVVTGCADDDDDAITTTPAPPPTGTTPPPPAGSSEIRVVHASPDAPAVDVWIEGQASPAVRDAKYGDASPYLNVAAGTYNFQIRPAGAAATDAPVYSTGPIDVPANAKITAIAAGLLKGTTDADKFRVLALPEAWQSAPDKVTVRVVHASPDAPTVGLDVGDDDPSAPEVADLARFADTGAAGIQLPAGEPLQVGITAGRARVTAFTTPGLPAGREIFIIATGLVGKLAREADGFALLAIAPQAAIGFVRQNPVLYALHASPDAPAVDLFVGTKEIAGPLAFGMLSAPIQVPPGPYRVDFFAATEGTTRPSTDPAATAPVPPLEAGQRYLAAATGFFARADATNKFDLAALAEGFDLTPTTNASARAWHLSPDAPAVDVGLETDGAITPVFRNLAYLQASDARGQAVPAETLPIGITPAGDPSNVLFSFSVPATSGARSFAIAAGAAAPLAGEQALRLLLVDTKATPWVLETVNATPH